MKDLPIATWRQMRSGDWKLSVAGKPWAVAFVWRTRDIGYAYAVNGHKTLYHPHLSRAKREVMQRWEQEARR